MAYSIKSLPPKQEDLSSSPQHPHKKPAMVVQVCNLSALGRWRQRTPRAHYHPVWLKSPELYTEWVTLSYRKVTEKNTRQWPVANTHTQTQTSHRAFVIIWIKKKYSKKVFSSCPQTSSHDNKQNSSSPLFAILNNKFVWGKICNKIGSKIIFLITTMFFNQVTVNSIKAIYSCYVCLVQINSSIAKAINKTDLNVWIKINIIYSRIYFYFLEMVYRKSLENPCMPSDVSENSFP